MKGRILIFPAIGVWLMLLCVTACGGMDTNATPTSEYSLEAILTRGAEQLATAQVMMTKEAQTPVFVTPSATIPAPQATMTAQAAQSAAQAAQPVLDSTKTWRVVSSDSFDANDNGWMEGDGKTIADGKYKWQITEPFNIFRGLPDNSPVRDFAASMDVVQVGGSEDCGMGLIFRNNAEGKYVFYIHDDQRWGFDIIHSPDPHIAQHGISDAIVAHGSNRVTVIAQGNRMILFVNGKYVTQAQDATLGEGKVGAAVWNRESGECQVEFDNFELRVPMTSSSPPTAPTPRTAESNGTLKRQVTTKVVGWLENARSVRNSAEMSPDGRRLATVLKSGNQKVVLLDGNEQVAYDDIVKGSSKFSPDSSHFAYVAQIGNKYAVVLDGVAGKQYDEIAADSLVFSPDSQHLAYSAQDGSKGFVVSDGRELQSYDRVGSMIAYSPDNQHLAYFATVGGFLGFGTQLVVVQDEIEGERYDHVDHLVYSPDSSRLAVAAMKGNKWVVAVNSVSGKEYDGVGKISFSPDSQHITYRARENGQDFTVVDGTESERFDQTDNSHFSPDSQHVAFGARSGDTWYLVFDNFKSKPYDDVFGQLPLFSPDSKHLVYSAKRGAKQFVVVDGQEKNKYDGVNLFSITFSPDSQRLAYGGTKQNHWTMVIDGKDHGLYTGMGVPHFSPDSQHVAYIASDGQGEQDTFVVVDGMEGERFGDIFPGTLQWADGQLHYLATRWDSTHTMIYLVQEMVTR